MALYGDIDNIKVKQCKECGNDFTPYHSTDRYCSFTCARAAAKPAKVSVAKVSRKTNREPTARVKAKTVCKKLVNYQCQLAGIFPHECDFRRDAHHIIYVSQREINEQWNLICLCNYAHLQIVHTNKRKWQPALFHLSLGADWRAKLDKQRKDQSPELAQILDYIYYLTTGDDILEQP
jgi:hypothetical protein